MLKLNFRRCLIFRSAICFLLMVSNAQALTLLDEKIVSGSLNLGAWNISGASGITTAPGEIRIANSFSASAWRWDQNSISTTQQFSQHALSISANLTVGTGTHPSLIMGLGDAQFSGSSALNYLFRLSSSGRIETFDFKNGVYNYQVCPSSGTHFQGARYEMKLKINGFDLYRNGDFVCSHIARFALKAPRLFFQSSVDGSPSIASAILVKTESPTVFEGGVEDGVIASDAFKVFGPNEAVMSSGTTLKVRDSFDPKTWKWSQSGVKTRTTYPMNSFPIVLESSIVVGKTADLSKGRYALLGLGDHDFLEAGLSPDGSRKGVVAAFVSANAVMLLHAGPTTATEVQYCGGYVPNAKYQVVIEKSSVKLFVDAEHRCTAAWNLSTFKAKPIIAQSSTDQTHSEFRDIKLSMPFLTDDVPVIGFQRKMQSYPWLATRDIVLRNELVQTIPYIQSDSTLALDIQIPNSESYQQVRMTLRDHNGAAIVRLSSGQSRLTPQFVQLPKGLYSLHVEGLTKSDAWKSLDFVSGIGIGDIVFALGDSITEGFWGDMTSDKVQNWAQAPASLRSKDRRNLPQFGPRTDVSPLTYKASYFKAISDAVNQRADYPVFFYNFGVGGNTASNLTTLANTAFFASRVAELKPSKYFVAIGINDANAAFTPSQYETHLLYLRDLIAQRSPNAPTYLARFSPASSAWNSCCEPMNRLSPSLLAVIDDLVRRGRYQSGPDLWTYFSSKLDALTSDGLHPNSTGMAELGRLWAQTVWP
jgi:GDSL-like Lipase/Acylhydrolase family